MKAVLSLTAIFCLCAFAEQAEEQENKAKDLLRKSQTDHSQLVPAAKAFLRALTLFEERGNIEKSVEMNSYLYWCKKKMNLDDIGRFALNSGEELGDRFKSIDRMEVKIDEAKIWLDRVNEFARKHPEDHFLIAVRYFEIADRFKGSEISLKAQDLSLQSLQKAAPRVSNVAPVEAPKPIIEGRLPVPSLPEIRKAEITVAGLFESERKGGAGADVEIAKKALAAARTSGDEPTVQYALFRLAIESFVRAGLASDLLQSIDEMSKRFDVDPINEKSIALSRIPLTSNEIAIDVFVAATQSMVDAKEQQSFDSLSSLATLSQTASLKTNLAGAKLVASKYSAHAKEIAREWPVIRGLWEKWKITPEDPSLNLAIGRFYAFVVGDWKRGLVALARGNDTVLKALAEQDLASNNPPGVLLAVADQWWDLSEKQKGIANTMMKLRAGKLYLGNLEAASAVNKLRAQQRISLIAKLNFEIIGGSVDVSGKYLGDFQQWKSPVLLTSDGRFRKTTDGLGGRYEYSGIKLVLNWDGFSPQVLYLDTPGVFRGKKMTLVQENK
jgi:hypothetical protein